MDREFKQYASTREFYADRGGRFSGESDFGCWHYDDWGLFGTALGDDVGSEEIHVGEDEFIVINAGRNNRIRVSVVDETGDVYALQSGIGEERVVLLGNLGVRNPPAEKGYDIRERGPVYDRAEEIFDG
ncbi:MAG: hypothetical protein OXI16_13765 [Chloroflexota bacterium]|nr:hypothetical protein [Chloroflexota bacterium]